MDLGIGGIGDATPAGQGAFGTVYRARHARLGEDVAVRVLPAQLDATTAEAFLRDCRTLERIGDAHPNLARVIDAGTTATGLPYVVSEYLPSGTMAAGKADGRRMDARLVTAVGVKLAGALQTLHEAGVLHRDVKPGNVRAGPYGEVKLADAGIGRLHSPDKSAAAIAHAAPELLDGAGPTAASDVYALGSTLFTLVAAHDAFAGPGDTIYTTSARISSDPVPDLRPAGVPAPLCDTIERAMAKRPQARPTTAVAFGEELRSVEGALGWPDTPVRVLDRGGQHTTAGDRVAGGDEFARQWAVAEAAGIDAPVPPDPGWAVPVPAGDEDGKPPPSRLTVVAFAAAALAVLGVAVVVVALLLSGGESAPGLHVTPRQSSGSGGGLPRDDPTSLSESDLRVATLNITDLPGWTPSRPDVTIDSTAPCPVTVTPVRQATSQLHNQNGDVMSVVAVFAPGGSGAMVDAVRACANVKPLNLPKLGDAGVAVSAGGKQYLYIERDGVVSAVVVTGSYTKQLQYLGAKADAKLQTVLASL